MDKTECLRNTLQSNAYNVLYTAQKSNDNKRVSHVFGPGQCTARYSHMPEMKIKNRKQQPKYTTVLIIMP